MAFLKAQKKIESVIKESTNPFFHSKYADLTAVIEACKEKLNNEDIAILQPLDGMNVETILIHISGEWFSSSTPIVCKVANDPQALGSAITYAKRYGLQSMVLLPAADDDGNAGAGNKPTTTAKITASKGTTASECSQCGIPDVPEQVIAFSNQKWGQTVCYKCQQKLKT